MPFYILWVPAGADRVAALSELRASGKIADDVPAYCAEWASRLTDHQRISDDEEAVLSKAICDDLESNGFSFNSSTTDDVRDQQRMCEMTDRELLGVILKSSIDILVSGSDTRPAPPTNVRFGGKADMPFCTANVR